MDSSQPHLALLLAVTAALIAAAPESPQEQEQGGFSDISLQVGVDFVHEPGAEGRFLLPEITGSGAAFLDFDGDSDLDIYLVQSGEPIDPVVPRSDASSNRLFRQEDDGRFLDVTDSAGVGDRGYGMGVAVGDIDNDGDLDIYVTNYGRDTLYRNLGGGRFENITDKAGIDGDFWSASAVFCDYDADGYLDLYVTHYVTYDPRKDCTRGDGSADYCAPQVFPGTPDVLYHNLGNGTFADVTLGSGLRAASSPGLGVVCADFDADGRPDFYVANDGDANQLWINRGDGTFVDEAFLAGAALNDMGRPEAGMGIAPGDVDADGDLDLFVTHVVEETNTLYVNDGNMGFEDRSTAAGLAMASLSKTGFGAGFFDYDHDGDLDLAIANGRVQRSGPLSGELLPPYWDVYAEPNQLMENDRNTRFLEVSERAGDFGDPVEVSRGLAFGDVDDDGDLDLLVMSARSRARLYRNDMPKNGDWLLVRAYDGARNADAHGALVTAIASGKRFVRVANPGFSYLSSNDPRAHFGLPRGSELEALEVRWPDGSVEKYPASGVNRVVVLEKGRGSN